MSQICTGPRLAETHVIVATADDLLAETSQEGVDLVLVKPIGFGQLRDLASRLK